MILLISLFTSSVLIHYFIYNNEKNTFISEILIKEKSLLEIYKKEIADNFETVSSDLNYLAHKNNIKEFLKKNKSKDVLKEIAEDYLYFSREKKIYDQIRILDIEGDELVRVNHNTDSTYIVPYNKLQSKGSRYYFKESIVLNKNKIFVSPFDLNVENGKVEEPIKPTIRIATPIFDENNDKQGILIFNYVANSITKSNKS